MFVKIIVLMKQVPDTEAKIQVKDAGIAEDGVSFVINPYDEFAIEEAIQIKEKRENVIVSVISLGPERSSAALRSALALGADEAVQLVAPSSYDSLAVAEVLADYLKSQQFDLILAGKQAIDDDNVQVPMMVATLLNVPCVSVVTTIEWLNDNKLKVRRETDNGSEELAIILPAIITTQKGLNEPRYASLKGIMRAKKITIETREVQYKKEYIHVEKLNYPPSRPPGRIVGEGEEAVPELVRLLKNEAKVI
jgi:electron transfer flavoprotein beta subunit